MISDLGFTTETTSSPCFKPLSMDVLSRQHSAMIYLVFLNLKLPGIVQKTSQVEVVFSSSTICSNDPFVIKPKQADLKSKEGRELRERKCITCFWETSLCWMKTTHVSVEIMNPKSAWETGKCHWAFQEISLNG